MTDLLTIYDVLTLPSGAQLVSDHGAVALLLVTRESPDKVMIERVPLGQAVSLLDAIQAAQQRGVELFTPSISVIAQKPAEAAPKALPKARAKALPAPTASALVREIEGGTPFVCPTPGCGLAFRTSHGLAVHRAKTHSIPGESRAQRGLSTVSAPVAPEPEPAAPAAPDADVPYSDLELELALASAPEALRCELCFDPTPAHLVVNGRKLCERCAARNPAPRWDGKVAIA